MAHCLIAREDVAPLAIDVEKERKRQKEVYRYLSTSLNPSLSHQGDPPPLLSSQPSLVQPSSDPILNGLAQLGALRMECDRSFISLLDNHKQYIIAEMTRSTSLMEENRFTDQGRLSFGACVIDAEIGICLNTLPVFTHEDGRFNIDTENIAASPDRYLIRDFTKHEHFKDRSFVTGPPHMRYYLEVPLKNLKGVVVGSYCVVHNEVKPDPSVDDLRLMNEIATTISHHLEHLRTQEEHLRASRLLKGLDLFVEGEDSLRQWYLEDYANKQTNPTAETPEQWANREFGFRHEGDPSIADKLNSDETTPKTPSGHSVTTVEDGAGNHQSQSTSMTSLPSPSRDMTNEPMSFPFPETQMSEALQRRYSHEVRSEGQESGSSEEGIPGHKKLRDKLITDEIEETFSRATNLLREAMDLEGVVCLDGCPKSFGSQAANTPGAAEQWPSSSNEEDNTSGDQSSKKIQTEYILDSPFVVRLGFSTRVKSSLANNAISDTRYSVPERVLQHLIQQYPRGHIFHIDEMGVLSPSEDSSERDMRRRPKTKKRSRTTRMHLREFRNWFPASCAIVFLPLWAAKSETCLGAFFGWSTEPTRTFSKRELTYLTSFGHSVMAEVTKLEMLSSDQAKSDFISSVSHELRSPLHGVLGSAEMLREICPESSQTQIISMIESCGVSLLETLNHILDFTKINNLTRKYGGQKLVEAKSPTTPGILETISQFDLSNMIDDVVNATLVAHQFHQTSLLSQSSRHAQNSSQNNANNSVCVILSIENRDSWLVKSDSGAWRRILMNLLGNALKYTSSGHIEVNLQFARSEKTRHGEEDGGDGNDLIEVVSLSVKDTGQGISKSYQKKHLFQPFTQENDLSSGTGLGLSIVKQLVDPLGGSIELSSEVGSGTHVMVSVPLVFPSTPMQSLHLEGLRLQFDQPSNEHDAKLNICLLGMDIFPVITDNIADAPSGVLAEFARTMLVFKAVLTQEFTQWFNASVSSATSIEQASGDIIVIPERQLSLLRSASGTTDMFTRPKGSCILILCDHASMTSNHIGSDLVQFIGAPYGPKNLERVLKKFSFQRDQAHQEPFTFTSSSINQPLNTSSPTLKPDLKLLNPESLTLQQQSRPTSLNSASVSNFQLPIQGIVLLVDDNPINLKMLMMCMSKLGREYLTASNGLEAVQAYQTTKHIKYVLMDISMPIMDGLVATREIRAFEKTHNMVPAIIAALTGLGSTKTQQEAYSSGIDIFLTKPVAMKTIKALLSGELSLNPEI